MSLYEELLTHGSHLHETERIALYKFLLESKHDVYLTDALELVRSNELKREIADGEILYSLNKNQISYSARKRGAVDYLQNLRSLQLKRFSKFQIKKIMKFFAQSEVDVIWNFPLQGSETKELGSFSIISLPYFDLRYYSARRSRILGLINKIKSDNSEILQQLRAS
jgi:GDP-D-mannose dehydratase